MDQPGRCLGDSGPSVALAGDGPRTPHRPEEGRFAFLHARDAQRAARSVACGVRTRSSPSGIHRCMQHATQRTRPLRASAASSTTLVFAGFRVVLQTPVIPTPMSVPTGGERVSLDHTRHAGGEGDERGRLQMSSSCCVWHDGCVSYACLPACCRFEQVMSLQKFKLNIANTVVNQENASLRCTAHALAHALAQHTHSTRTALAQHSHTNALTRGRRLEVPECADGTPTGS